MRNSICKLLLAAGLLICAHSADAQHAWQKPSALMKRAEVEKLIGTVGNKPFSEPRHIVWVWGYDGGHRPGNHDYTRVRDLMVGLLKDVSGVTVETAYLFPTEQQFARADLVVMYLHLPGLDASHYALLDPYLRRGGGLVAIHETMIQRPRARGEQWAERIGLAWSEGKSQWGALFTKVFVDNRHPIFANFPERVELVDEFYWQLTSTKDKDNQQTLATVPVGSPGSSRGPIPEDRLSRERHPVFWTRQFGKGRVFCTLPGHNTFLFYDPKFRIILLRGMAWAMHEKPDPLMPLVFAGIEHDDRFGTTDTMRNWRTKPRNLKGEGFAPDAKVATINATTNRRLGIGTKQAAAPAPEVKHIIDTHIHLYDTTRKEGVPWPPPDDKVLYKPHLPDEFRRVARPAGVTGVVIVEASDRLEDNRWVLDLVKGDDFFVALVGNIDPYRKDFAVQLEKLRRDPRFVGVRLRLSGKKIDYSDQRVLANLRLLAKTGLSADILMNSEGPETIQAIDRLAREIPALRLIVDHVLGYNIDGKPPGEEWIAVVRRLAENPNVYVKVSGLYRRCVSQPASQDPSHYRALLDVLWEDFGSKRLIYGSNWPCTKKSGDYASFVRLVNAYFDEKGREATERYFWKNAAEAYKLKLK